MLTCHVHWTAWEKFVGTRSWKDKNTLANKRCQNHACRLSALTELLCTLLNAQMFRHFRSNNGSIGEKKIIYRLQFWRFVLLKYSSQNTFNSFSFLYSTEIKNILAPESRCCSLKVLHLWSGRTYYHSSSLSCPSVIIKKKVFIKKNWESTSKQPRRHNRLPEISVKPVNTSSVRSKFWMIFDVITDCKIDVLCLTETKLNGEEAVIFEKFVPQTHSFNFFVQSRQGWRRWNCLCEVFDADKVCFPDII